MRLKFTVRPPVPDSWMLLPSRQQSRIRCVAKRRDSASSNRVQPPVCFVSVTNLLNG